MATRAGSLVKLCLSNNPTYPQGASQVVDNTLLPLGVRQARCPQPKPYGYVYACAAAQPSKANF